MLTTGCGRRAYNHNAGLNMNYATSSPAATPGVSGNVPVSWHLFLVSRGGIRYRQDLDRQKSLSLQTSTWLHLLIITVGIYSRCAKTARLRRRRYGAEMRLARSFVMLAASS